MVHNSCIILDDIEDGSLTRRGKAAIHVEYGLDTAINASVMMMFGALSKMSNYIAPEKSTKFSQTIADGILGLYLGQ